MEKIKVAQCSKVEQFPHLSPHLTLVSSKCDSGPIIFHIPHSPSTQHWKWMNRNMSIVRTDRRLVVLQNKRKQNVVKVGLKEAIIIHLVDDWSPPRLASYPMRWHWDYRQWLATGCDQEKENLSYRLYMLRATGYKESRNVVACCQPSTQSRLNVGIKN